MPQWNIWKHRYLCVTTIILNLHQCINTLRPKQNGRRFPDDTFKHIFLNENVWILIEIPLKFVPKGPINNIPALVKIMAWRRPGDKPLSEPVMVRLPTHIFVSRPQGVNSICPDDTTWHRNIILSAIVRVMTWRHQAITWTNIDLLSATPQFIDALFIDRFNSW